MTASCRVFVWFKKIGHQFLPLPIVKRLVAISLLGLMLFNIFGYYVLFAYEQAEARRVQIANLPDSAFEVVKLLASPYVHLEDTHFEFVEGAFRIKDKTYSTVKQRIVNDSLEIYCLPNVRADQSTTRFNDFVQDQFCSKNSPSPNDPLTKQLFKFFFKRYLPQSSSLIICQNALDTEGGVLVKIRATNATFRTSVVVEMDSPPPEVA